MEKIVDYAYPTMMAEKCLRGVHEAFLDKKFEEADQMASEAAKWIVEIRWALRKSMLDGKAKT